LTSKNIIRHGQHHRIPRYIYIYIYITAILVANFNRKSFNYNPKKINDGFEECRKLIDMYIYTNMYFSKPTKENIYGNARVKDEHMQNGWFY